MCAALAAAGVAFALAEDLPFPTDAAVTAAVGLVDLGAASRDGESGLWTVDVPAAVVAVPGDVTVTWAADDGSLATSTIDVRDGNPLPFSLLRAQLGRGENTSVSEILQRQALQDALVEFEAECRCAMVPKRTTETLVGSGRAWLLDQNLPIRVVEAPDGLTVDDCRLLGGGVVEFARALPGGGTITYDHGQPALAPDVARAVALLAASRLADGPWDDRGYGVSGDGGHVALMTAGMGRSRFSIPQVQAAYQRHRILEVA